MAVPLSGAQAAATSRSEPRSLEIRRREIFGVLGPNGSGKSTLIRLIATLLIPDGGRITVFGRDVVEEARAVQTLINRVSVEASFFKKLSPMENLMYGARLYGVSASETRARVKDILSRLGLEQKTIYRPMEEMSRGMQQKVAIARAFLSQPVLLLLDEPTTGLDPRSKREVQAFVRELRDTHDATILLTTHDMVEAEALCDRIAILNHGEIVALDDKHALLARGIGGTRRLCVTTRVPVVRLPDSLARRLRRQEDNRLEFELARDTDSVIELLDALRAHGAEIADLATESADLEDVFVELTRNRPA